MPLLSASSIAPSPLLAASSMPAPLLLPVGGTTVPPPSLPGPVDPIPASLFEADDLLPPH
jgi:hypothetical protein